MVVSQGLSGLGLGWEHDSHGLVDILMRMRFGKRKEDSPWALLAPGAIAPKSYIAGSNEIRDPGSPEPAFKVHTTTKGLYFPVTYLP